MWRGSIASAVAVFGILGGALPALATDTVGVVDPSSGLWTLRAENGATTTIGYGDPADVPFMGDWDCDGVDTPGLYRRSDGRVYLRNSNTTGVADVSFFFGNPGDVPLAGDFDGDGCDTVSIYRPSEGRFYIINRLGSGDAGLGAADTSFLYGNQGDVPFVGDWNGDGVDTPGLRRSSNGFVYLRNSNSQGVADLSYFYGDPGDVVFAGDWNGNGIDTLGLFRPSNATMYLKNSNATGIADVMFRLGGSRSQPVAGSFGLSLPPPPPPLALRLVASGLERPLFVAAPPGDPRLFAVEQGGDIEIVGRGTFLRVPVTCCEERGLLGLAFHPDYARNGRFFVNYTLGSETRISEFRVSADPDRADPSSERVVLRVAQPFTNHNGGMLTFDPNGYLLIALGDGGGAGDPQNNAENPSSLLGKILRIDVDRPEGGRAYAIPPDNPFRSGGGAAEVWLLGLRNPWRFAVDGGYLYIADVGQNAREEVTVVPVGLGGANLGWNTWEGTSCYQAPCVSGGFVFPQLEYTHAEGRSITGGFVYRGRDIPGLAGTYFYGDFAAGWIRSFRFQAGAVTDRVDRTPEFGTVRLLSSFGYDGFGELYVTSLDGGRVFKIVAAG
jgi:glucose/arabinose dehydrogenase